MPASRSRNRELKPAPKTKLLIWPIVLAASLAIAAIVLLVLPASIITHFLPPQIQAEDFSGSIWHGSSGQFSVASRSAGALEWRLHPLSLLSLALAADVRWVKGATAIDAAVTVDRRSFTARDMRGGGPLEDLHGLGIAPGCSGDIKLGLQEIKGSFDNLESAVGSIEVSALASNRIAHGEDLGGYVLTLSPGAVNAQTLVATLKDTGGPLEVLADIHYVPRTGTGSLTGFVKEREGASAALRDELSQLAQIRARDNFGRIPVELEFAM
jgi:hypothetical protein